ncbi:uncharacterized protein LOC142637163 [Castanea sativa]|uniref:uncharacterized protein LOC142637163 n=1 Tax=Castanea sativa TaxID=21020 RepID=UPI003F64F1E3
MSEGPTPRLFNMNNPIKELLRHQQRANSYFSSSGASACLNLNGYRKESLSDRTTWKARTPAMPPQSTQKFFARYCSSIWSMLIVGNLALSAFVFLTAEKKDAERGRSKMHIDSTQVSTIAAIPELFGTF